MPFEKATKKQHKARVAFDGPTGAGKTFSAMILAQTLAEQEGGRFAVIDTEKSSASLYSDLFDFDVCELTNYDTRNYIQALREAEAAGYKVVIIDSLSHAWEGEGGVLDQNSTIGKQKYHGNNFAAWMDTTPIQRKLVDTILGTKAHVIVTMRSKMEYVQNDMVVDGRKKTVIEKIGLAPVQRAGIEYEFDLIVDLDVSHTATVSKTRCNLMDGKSAMKPDKHFWGTFIHWLSSGAPVTETTTTTQPEPDDLGEAGTAAFDQEVNGRTQRPASPLAQPVTMPAAKVNKPSQKMKDSWSGLFAQAKEHGLTVESLDMSTISAEDLAEHGKLLRQRIDAAKAAVESPLDAF
jgi:KaiC/GvpD/RAD55 family RecA-like ATPase